MQLGPIADQEGVIGAFVLAVEDIGERRRTEMARRLAEEGYEKVFHRSPYPVLIFDPATRLVHNVNEAALAKYGYSREEFIGLDVLDLRPPEDGPGLLEHLATGLPDFDRSFARHRLADGRLIDVEVVGQAFEVGGRKLRLVYIEDVTEQRRAAVALSRSEAANRASIEAVPDLIFRVSRDGRYLSFVPAPGFPLAGRPEEFLGQPLGAVLPPDVAATARKCVAEALSTSEAQTFEYELPEQLCARVRSVSAPRSNTLRSGWRSSVSTECFYRSTAHSATFSATPTRQLVGMGLAAITHPDDVETNLDLIRRSVAGQIDSFRMDKRNIHADGHIVWGDSRLPWCATQRASRST